MFIIIPKENLNTSCDFNAECMRRVHSVYYLKKVINPITLEIFGLLILTAMGTFFVSLGSIVKNSPQIIDFPNLANFWMGAFYNTEWSNKALLMATVFILGLLIFQILRYAKPIKTAAKIGLKWGRLFKQTA